MLGLGLGLGRGNPRWRALRLGLLMLVVVAALVFHGHGKAYESVRIVYYVAIVALLFGGRLRRGRAGPAGTSSGPGGYGPPGGGPAA